MLAKVQSSLNPVSAHGSIDAGGSHISEICCTELIGLYQRYLARDLKSLSYCICGSASLKIKSLATGRGSRK